MALNRFRQFRGKRTISDRFDGDTFDGIGQAMRHNYGGADEGDARMLDLIQQLRKIEGRPEAPDE